MSILRTLAGTIASQDGPILTAYISWCQTFNKPVPGAVMTDREVETLIGFTALATGFARAMASNGGAIYSAASAGSHASLTKPATPEDYYSPSLAHYIGSTLSPEGVDALGWAFIRANDGWGRTDNVTECLERLKEDFARMGGKTEAPVVGNAITGMGWAQARADILANGTKEQRALAEKERQAKLDAERKALAEKLRLEAEELERQRLLQLEHDQRELLLGNRLGGSW